MTGKFSGRATCRRWQVAKFAPSAQARMEFLDQLRVEPTDLTALMNPNSQETRRGLLELTGLPLWTARSNRFPWCARARLLEATS